MTNAKAKEHTSLWIAGEPKVGFFGLDTSGAYVVSAYRCEKCGYLALFATERQ